MRSRRSYPDYHAEPVSEGWTLQSEQGCERVYGRDGEQLVATVCRTVRGDLFVTREERRPASR